jgi:hypothetical protein
MQADGIGVEGLQQGGKQQNRASEHSDSSGAPGEQLDCRGFSRALAICRPGHVGDDEEQQQYQWHKCHGAIFRQIVSNPCRDPRERESGKGPLFKFDHAENNEDDRAKEFGDPKNNAQVLRLSDASKSLNCLRTAG